MKFNKLHQDCIHLSIKSLLDKSFVKNMFSEIKKKSKENRISSEVELIIKRTIKEFFDKNSGEFQYIKSIEYNNGSSKAPYELLFSFSIDGVALDVYFDLKPINTDAKTSTPFMGSVKKQIKRMCSEKYYDISCIVRYNAPVNSEVTLVGFDIYFVKDITNFRIYTNWQLMLNMQHISQNYGRNPSDFLHGCNNILEDLKRQHLSHITKIEKIQKEINIAE